MRRELCRRFSLSVSFVHVWKHRGFGRSLGAEEAGLGDGEGEVAGTGPGHMGKNIKLGILYFAISFVLI